MTLKYIGRSKKTERRTGPKNKGSSLAVCTYLQRGSRPHLGVRPTRQHGVFLNSTCDMGPGRPTIMYKGFVMYIMKTAQNQ